MIASSKAIAFSAFFLLFANAAHAGPPSTPATTPPPSNGSSPGNAEAPSDGELQTARSLYRDALLLLREGKPKEAYNLLSAAYRTVKTPVIALELAKLEAKFGHLAVAHDLLRSIEDMPQSPRESDKGREARQEAQSLASTLKERLGNLGWTTPSTPGHKWTVVFDGQTVELPTDRRFVDPGPHVLALSIDGRVCASQRVELAEGETRIVDWKDREKDCVAESGGAAPSPVLSPSTSPTPGATPRPKPVANDGPPPNFASVSRESSGGSDTTRWVAMGLTGAGAVATLAGAYVALRAHSEYTGVDSQCSPAGCTREAFEVRQAARSSANTASVIVGLGLSAVAGGIALWTLSPSKDPKAPSVQVALSSQLTLTVRTP